MQDEIEARLANALDTELVAAEARCAEQAPTPNSMDLYFRGMASFNKGLTPEYLSQARDFFERSLALDPGNISAQVGATAVHVMAANTYQTDDQTVRLASAEEALMGVLLRVPDHAYAHFLMGLTLTLTHRPSQGIAEYERALALDSNLVQKRPMVDFMLFAQSTFLGSACAMLGYAGGAQVMIFYLPLFLQNAFDLSPAVAGLAMLPFALPMVLTPRLGAGLARRYSGRTLLTVGLMTTLIGNLLLWALARLSLPYPAFLLGMLVAGAGAGLLNSETTKVMQGAVPVQRAGMASGLTAVTRFIGLLVGIAALGAVLAQVASRSFVAGGVAAGLGVETAAELAKHVTSGDVVGIVGTVPEALRASVWQIGNAAFADGFAAAALLAAAVAAAMALFTVLLVRRAETLPVTLAEGESLGTSVMGGEAYFASAMALRISSGAPGPPILVGTHPGSSALDRTPGQSLATAKASATS